MYIIKNDILEILRNYKKMSETAIAGQLSVKVNEHTDTIATLYMLEDAKTIIFDAEQALALVPAIRRFAEELDFRLPFPSVIFQFTEPISETDILAQERQSNDKITALIVTQTENGINNASVWFESTAVNRAQWENESIAPLRISPTAMEEEEETDFLIADNLTPAEIKIRNKEIIRLLACAMVAYINCENVTIERQVQASEAVNRKRLAKGKKPLEPFYITRIRGVHHELYKPKVYEVE